MARTALKPEKLLSDLPKLLEALNGEAPLPCALMAGAFIENALMTLLSSFFIKGSETAKRMISPEGSLGTFSSRGDMAYCLGLISKATVSNVRLIGEIRNLFAHSHVPIDFDNDAVKERCLKLKRTDFGSKPIPFDETLSKLDWSKQSPRMRFSLASISVLQMILVAITRTKHREEHQD